MKKQSNRGRKKLNIGPGIPVVDVLRRAKFGNDLDDDEILRAMFRVRLLKQLMDWRDGVGAPSPFGPLTGTLQSKNQNGSVADIFFEAFSTAIKNLDGDFFIKIGKALNIEREQRENGGGCKAPIVFGVANVFDAADGELLTVDEYIKRIGPIEGKPANPERVKRILKKMNLPYTKGKPGRPRKSPRK